jgi:hypothetical protein
MREALAVPDAQAWWKAALVLGVGAPGTVYRVPRAREEAPAAPWAGAWLVQHRRYKRTARGRAGSGGRWRRRAPAASLLSGTGLELPPRAQPLSRAGPRCPLAGIPPRLTASVRERSAASLPYSCRMGRLCTRYAELST